MQAKIFVALVECNGQAVRLVNPNPNIRQVVKSALLAGRVETCNNGEFRTICDDFWTNPEASLLCKELGFSEFGNTQISVYNLFVGFCS